MKNAGLFIATSSLCLVLPYASNATVIALAVSVIGQYNFFEFVKNIKSFLKNHCFSASLAIIALGFLSSLWSVAPMTSFNLSSRLLGLFFLLNLSLFIINKMPSYSLLKLQKTAVYSIILTLLFYSIDLITNGGFASIIKGEEQLTLTRIGRGASILALLMFPTAVLIYKQKQKQKLITSLAFFVLCGLVIFMLPMRSPTISIILGGISFLLVYYFKKPAIVTLFSIMIALILFTPLISLKLINLKTVSGYSNIIPSSWRHRLVIWEYSSNLAYKNPLLGYGLEASRELGKEAPRLVISTHLNYEHPVLDSALPLHPHNFAVQIWLELGILGALSFAWLFFNLMKYLLLQKDLIKTASLCSTITAGFFISAFSFGIWQNWWLAGLFLTTIFSQIAYHKNTL